MTTRCATAPFGGSLVALPIVARCSVNVILPCEDP